MNKNEYIIKKDGKEYDLFLYLPTYKDCTSTTLPNFYAGQNNLSFTAQADEDKWLEPSLEGINLADYFKDEEVSGKINGVKLGSKPQFGSGDNCTYAGPSCGASGGGGYAFYVIAKETKLNAVILYKSNRAWAKKTELQKMQVYERAPSRIIITMQAAGGAGGGARQDFSGVGPGAGGGSGAFGAYVLDTDHYEWRLRVGTNGWGSWGKSENPSTNADDIILTAYKTDTKITIGGGKHGEDGKTNGDTDGGKGGNPTSVIKPTSPRPCWELYTIAGSSGGKGCTRGSGYAGTNKVQKVISSTKVTEDQNGVNLLTLAGGKGGVGGSLWGANGGGGGGSASLFGNGGNGGSGSTYGESGQAACAYGAGGGGAGEHSAWLADKDGGNGGLACFSLYWGSVIV